MSVLTHRWMTRQGPPLRTPSIRQVQETECGVAALAIVLAHYGAWVSFPELRRLCNVSDHGVTALSLVQAGKHYGLALRGMRIGVDALQHMPAPLILQWDAWHFVVLEGVSGEFAWINDPARGHRRVSLNELRKSYSGVALIAKPRPDFKHIGNPRQPLKVAAKMLRPARAPLTLLAAASIVEAVLLPATVSIAGSAINDDKRGRSEGWQPSVLALGGLVAARAVRIWSSDRTKDAMCAANATVGTGTDENHAAVAHTATTSIQIITSGIRMSVSVPLLLRILARLHPAAALLTMPALAAPLLSRKPTGRHADLPSRLPSRAVERLTRIRPVVLVTPALVAGVLSTEKAFPSVIVALGTTWIAFRLVDSAVDAIGMLYLVPESIIEIASGRGNDHPVSDIA